MAEVKQHQTATGIDPLELLPTEIVLRVLDFTCISSLASLTRVSQTWHQFIDVSHQDAIYSHTNKTRRSGAVNVRDFSHINHEPTFERYFDDSRSWKDLCKRQTLLARNWHAPRPVTKESIIQVGNDPVWRFKPDLKRRLILSTSQAGGFRVEDLDSGKLLWHLSQDDVRSYAHLEYEDGTVVWDREGNALEVWKTGLEGLARGEFRKTAVLPHDCVTRGFQLSHDTLCVASAEGQGFVYDMTQSPPMLTAQLDIEHGAIGHLDQDADCVVFSFGDGAYHGYRKSGDNPDEPGSAYLSQLDPAKCTDYWHIKHPHRVRDASFASDTHGPTPTVFPPGNPQSSRLTPLTVQPGPLPSSSVNGGSRVLIDRDEWGAGMMSGDLFVGISRNGRVFLCPKYRQVLEQKLPIEQHSTIIECESDGHNFDLGGWLSVKDNRVLFEIQGRIYVVAVNGQGKPYTDEDDEGFKRASWAMTTASAPQLTVPVSMMAVFDDCIMATYTTLGWRQFDPQTAINGQPEAHGRIFPTKTIRIISLAPELDDMTTTKPKHLCTSPSPELTSTKRHTNNSQMHLLQLLSLLGAEMENEEAGIELLDDVLGLEDEDDGTEGLFLRDSVYEEDEGWVDAEDDDDDAEDDEEAWWTADEWEEGVDDSGVGLLFDTEEHWLEGNQ